MKTTIDLNADLGEGMLTDNDLMAFISSANIACGCHAGNADTMRRTVAHCVANNIAVGAHPSYADRAHFGRKEMNLPSAHLYDLIQSQLEIFQRCCYEMGANMHHVKPHGALYNQSARSLEVAHTIATAVKAFQPALLLYGLAGSISISAAEEVGITAVHEFFADRTYQPDGQLTPRTMPNALIESPDAAANQAVLIAKERSILSSSGTRFSVADCPLISVCLHGDSIHAVAMAGQVHAALLQAGFQIQACK